MPVYFLRVTWKVNEIINPKFSGNDTLKEEIPALVDRICIKFNTNNTVQDVMHG